jgi:hypothetical protein
MESSFADGLAPHRTIVAYVLLGLGVAMAAIPIASYFFYGWQGAWELIVWGVLLAASALGGGVYLLASPPSRDMGAAVQLRLTLITVGGLFGLFTAALGVLLPILRYRDIFTSPLPEWALHAGVVWSVVLALVGGKALLLGCLLTTRGMERSSALARRVLYGYNAFLSCYLLFLVLLLFNFIIHAPLPGASAFSKEYDWTAKGVYTLSEASQEQLKKLTKSVKVYAIFDQETAVVEDTATLLNNCHAVNDKFTWKILSWLPNRDEILKLHNQYQLPDDPIGLLVVYGDEPSVESTFVKKNDLVKDVFAFRGDDEPRKYTFKGEGVLMTAIEFLEQGKAKSVIYFTQGNGELAFSGGFNQLERGIGELVKRLGKGNYDVRELQLGPDVQKLPADAGVVIVARPMQPLAETALKALRDFLSLEHEGGQKGKLIVLLEAPPPGGKLVHTGLEELVAEFGVHVGNDRVERADPGAPTRLVLLPAPNSANPVAKAFFRGGSPELFFFNDIRTVEPATGRPNPQFTVDPLLVTLPQEGAWSETDMGADPATMAKELRKQIQEGKFPERISRSPICTAVAVSEGGAPPIPGHPPIGSGSKPRMVVFGAGGWLSDEEIGSREGGANYDLFASVLYWLREKPNLGVGPADTDKPREDYNLKLTDDPAFRLRMLPLGLLVLGVLALGLGVWVVRRR